MRVVFAVLWCVLIACVVVSSSSPAAAADDGIHLGTVTVPKTEQAPPIDGTLDSPVWKAAAVTQLGYDLRYHAPAKLATTVYLLTDGTFLYVGVDARQNVAVRATEHTNGVGLDTDDEVQVDLWPSGANGFRYKFTSTPIGTHYQYSSENNAFEPDWRTAGRIVDGGYIVNMRIPLSVMHGTGSGDWRVQFIRYAAVTNDIFVWSYGATQQNFNDVTYAGSLSGLPRLGAARGKARVGVYALGEAAAQSIGGDRVRSGADISLPIIPGTSFVGTLYPDYSNVEIDQQTIAPTAFQRFFNDVRPFFTQGANVYSYPNGVCQSCPGIAEFYTPAIPTPREGYAVEGQHGLFSYGALHTVIAGRTDTGDAIDYVSPNQETAINFQGSQVDAAPGLVQPFAVHDAADGMTFEHSNLKDLQVYARYATDRGTDVLDAAQAQRYEAGAGWFNPSGASFYATERKIGAYFDPVDAFVQHPDIAGYDLDFFAPSKFPTTGRFTELDFGGDLARYHDHTGALDQTNTGVNASLTTRTLFNLQLSTGSSYVRLPSALGAGETIFTPVTQQGGQLGYNLNGLLPSFVSFQHGRFGPGELDSWARSTTMRVGTRGALTLEDDDTDQAADSGERFTQWLERASYAYQSGPNQSLAVGIRRIIGTPPELVGAPAFSSAWNLSAAFHQKVPGGELYVVYGDASAFATAPRFIVKYIKYFGADKGT